MGRHHAEVPSPGVAAFIGFATPAKLALVESAGASALHTLSFSVDLGDATGTQGIGVCAEYTAIR